MSNRYGRQSVSAEETPAEPIPCPPCSGNGTVISNLGGSPNTIECPWCEGSGVWLPEHNAQEHWRAPEQSESAAG